MPAKKKLYRSTEDRQIAGVAAGIAEYLDIDVTLIRILFIVVFLLGGNGFLVYLILWFAIPERPNLVEKLKNDYLEDDY